MFSNSTFTFNTTYGTSFQVTLAKGKYGNGAKALQLIDAEDGMPYGVATVNTGKIYGDDLIAVKDWSENEGMVDFLKEIGFIDRVAAVDQSGYVTVPICHLTPEAVKFFEER